ncbi:MAG TPA: IS66 family transposase [Solirubrobacteraceae bacterium]|nr:IS66 family transposase [Solirubrobacteraceae bacterium]
MTRRARAATSTEFDLRLFFDTLDCARPLLPPERYSCLDLGRQVFLDMIRLLHERGATITRMRRLFGIRTTEKFSAVFPARTAANDETPPPTAGNREDLGEDERDDGHDPRDGSKDGGATGAGRSATPDPEDRASAESGGDAPGTRRKGHGRIAAAAYRHAGCTHVEHDRAHVGDTCPECCHGTLYRLREPERIVRITGQPLLAAHTWELDRLRCSGCGGVFTAPAPLEAQGNKYDERAAGIMALVRYGVGMPLHRLARLQHNLETPVPASTQWEVVRDRVDAVVPAHDELRRRAASGRVLHNDDTSVRILELMGKRRAELVARGELPDPDRTGLFTTGIVSITADGPIALFCSGRKHGGENFTSLLAARDPQLPPPIHMCDGLDRNRPSGHVVVEANCNAHGRRHIVDEANNFPTECRHVLELLGKVFQIDEQCKEQGLSDAERLAVHQRDSAPVMAELQRWMRAELDEKRVEPNSGLGDAFDYLLRRWDKLTLFLRVPGAPLDNNICERALKMAIRHRNNSLFYRSQRGARVGDIYMTLIYTAELHGENPFEYLVALFTHPAEVAADPSAWLPWTFRAALARASPAAA